MGLWTKAVQEARLVRSYNISIVSATRLLCFYIYKLRDVICITAQVYHVDISLYSHVFSLHGISKCIDCSVQSGRTRQAYRILNDVDDGLREINRSI